MLRQPAELLVERGGDLHRGGGDEDVVVHLQAAHDALRLRHDRQALEEVFGAKIAFQRLVAIGGDDVPQPLALEVGHGDLFIVVAVVAKEVFGECVCHHLIHIDADTLHSDALTMDAAMLSSFCACFFCGASRAGSQ